MCMVSPTTINMQDQQYLTASTVLSETEILPSLIPQSTFAVSFPSQHLLNASTPIAFGNKLQSSLISISTPPQQRYAPSSSVTVDQMGGRESVTVLHKPTSRASSAHQRAGSVTGRSSNVSRKGSNYDFGQPSDAEYPEEARDDLVRMSSDVIGNLPETIGRSTGGRIRNVPPETSDVEERRERNTSTTSGPLGASTRSRRASNFRGHFSDETIARRVEALPAELVDLLQAEVGEDLDIKDMLDRLQATETNLVSGMIPKSKRVDLSRKLKVEDSMRRSLWNLKTDQDGHIVRPLDKMKIFLRRFLKPRKAKPKDDQTHGSRHDIGPASRPQTAPAFLTMASQVHPAIDPSRSMNNAPLVIPPAPSHIDPSDNTQLAIHYHEIDNLEVSVYYLERASGEGNPLGLYLLGMCLRHGWGVEEDRRRATRCFIRSAQATVVGVYEVWKRGKEQKVAQARMAALVSSMGSAQLPEVGPSASMGPGIKNSMSQSLDGIGSSKAKASVYSQTRIPPAVPPIPAPVPLALPQGLTKKSASPSCESLSNSIDSRQSRVHTQRSASFFPSLARRPSNMSHTSTTSRAFSTWSVFATASRIITGSLSTNPALTFTLGDFQTDMGIMCSILPLPLYELGICFRHGWGVPRSLPAAFYYFSAAGASGDSEAMVEAAYCLLNGTGVAKNRKESGKWFRMAVEAGYEVLGEGWIWKDKWK